MLTTISAKNFKAFGQSPGLELSLSKLTLLLGQNNSGKTSALDVVALLVQTARTSPNYSGMAWSGELIDLGPSGEFAFHNAIRTGSMGIGAEIQAPRRLHKLLSRLHLDNQTIGYRVSFRPEANRYEHEFLAGGQVFVRNLIKESPTRGYQPEIEIRNFSAERLGVDSIPSVLSQGDIFNPSLFTAQNLHDATPEHKAALDLLDIAREGVKEIRNVLEKQVFLLGPNRGTHRTDLAESVKFPDVGRNGQHTLQVLSAVFAKAEHRDAAEKIREWSNVFGLLDVSSGWAGGKELHSGYADHLTSVALPLRSSGFGSQQVLPIIVQLFASPRNSVVIIEEPEISLHPAAQVQLIRMFSDAVRMGRQVILTTHSQYLVMAIQQPTDGSIQPDEISAYHFSRTRDESTAERLQIDANGVLRGWIPSFAEVEKDLLNKWMTRVHDSLSEE
jgi:energy-coupling factor transporter ATP-binding protein EcfA2